MKRKLKDCCTIIAGQSPESKYYNTDGQGLPFFQGKADFGELYPSIRVYCSQPTKIAEKDDILLSVRAPVGPTNLAPCRVCIGRGLTAIRPSEDLLTRYVLLFLRYFEVQLVAKGMGTTFKAVTQDIVKNLEIPVPSLQEQERLVARTDELFSELDAGVETLQKIKQQLAVYRQAALKTVFDRYQEYVPLGTISNSRLGKMLDKEKNIGIPRAYLRNVNVRWFAFDLSDMLEMRITDEEVDKYSIQKDDLVICEGGEPGRCAVWQEEGSVFYQKALHRVRFTNGSNPRFYMYYFWFAAQTGRLTPYYTGMGIKHLTGESLVKVSVPNTDRTEQDSMVAETEARLSMCEDIERTIDKGLQQSAAMRQNILKQAFEGGL